MSRECLPHHPPAAEFPWTFCAR